MAEKWLYWNFLFKNGQNEKLADNARIEHGKNRKGNVYISLVVDEDEIATGSGDGHVRIETRDLKYDKIPVDVRNLYTRTNLWEAVETKWELSSVLKEIYEKFCK